MARRFDWLDRAEAETVPAYDKRINELSAFHAGYAFLTRENYCEEFSAFAVYVLWNGECNKKLTPPLPSGGFMMHCGRDEAEELLALGHGLPIFIKLYSKLGMLHAEELAVADGERIYDLYFNGCECITPQGLCFSDRKDPSGPAEEEKRRSSGPLRGSYFSGSFFRGRSSYPGGSFFHRAYPGSSYPGGSYRTALSAGSYVTGSYVTGSFSGYGGTYVSYGGSYQAQGGSYRAGGLSGSYLSWLFGGGSYRYLYGAGSGFSGIFGGSYFAGSFRFGRWIFGSFSQGSYLGYQSYGSFHRSSFFTGSYYAGSYQRGSFTRGGFSEPLQESELLPYPEENFYNAGPSVFGVRRLSWELGYGLDLI
ncbi:MAG: hypothetical protein IK115_06065 [Lachnospiraceae bacterium]|nr:hypothetical protein [Lachnospiraceae bacterium]